MLGLTRIGKCPVCGLKVERNYTDIFYPYCGYKCKRVVQRKEEAALKKKIEKQQRKYEEALEKERIRRENAALMREKKQKIE